MSAEERYQKAEKDYKRGDISREALASHETTAHREYTLNMLALRLKDERRKKR